MIATMSAFQKAFVVVVVVICSCCLVAAERSFTIDMKNDCFLKDGQPFRYISGGIHYFRVPQFYWNDRLMKIKAAGANAIQTYIAWNLHEPVQGQFNFEGDLDIVQFINMAQKNDLLVIIRAGPYICAEWDFGGLPSWLLKNRSIALRASTNSDYMYAVNSWLSILLAKLKPLLYENGGPVIALQVENEYGSYAACDATYLNDLESRFRFILGDSVVLFTTDGYNDEELKCGGTSTMYRTVDFGAQDPTVPFQQQRKFQPHGPLVNSEYYVGWLDVWGQPHQTRDPKTIAAFLDKILAMNASVNMYMFEGGTNFGFMNGATSDGGYGPVPTSYDYDAPLSEAGDPTEKYKLIQAVIAKHTNIPPAPIPPATKKFAYGKMMIDTYQSMYDLLPYMFPSGATKTSQYPLSMEDLGQSYGFVMYRTNIAKYSTSPGKLVLDVGQLRDRVVIMVDEIVQGRIDRIAKSSTITISTGTTLDILLENEGRINYGNINDPKGLLSNVTLSGSVLENWQMFSLPLNEDHTRAIASSFSQVRQRARRDTSPVVFVPSIAYVQFTADQAFDTFLKLDGWGKGIAILNGHNLGRYWQTSSPQKTLFVPGPFLNSGSLVNLLMLFELDQSPCLVLDPGCAVEFVDTPVWG